MITQENIPYTADEIKAMVKTCEKYNKALEKAKKLYGKYCINNVLEDLFPELKESEDKENKKVSVGVIKAVGKFEWGELNAQDILAWLEKQGNKFVNIDVESMVSSYEQKLESQGGTKYTPLVNMCLTAFRHGIENVLEELNLKKLEKQGEQKHFSDFKAKDWYVSKVDGKIHNMTYNPTDKVEPKFKVGDWITDGHLICKVLSVTGKSYELHLYNDDYCHFETDVQSVDKRYHLWTIEEAKDGDVLCYEIKNDFKIFIYKQGHIHYHCCYSNEHLTPVESFFTLQKHQICYIHPATKEQRDLLFQKMKEFGYEWDNEKKELKKIEVVSKESEDERIRKALIDWIRAMKSNFRTISSIKIDDIIAWLEKQGEFNDNIITRNDEILQAISIGLTNVVENAGWSDFGGIPIEEIQDWLEKQGEGEGDKEKNVILPDVYDDERIRNSIALVLTDVDESVLFNRGVTLRAALNWLEKQGEKKSDDEVMKIRRKAYSDGYKHGQDNIAIFLGKESIEALEHFVRSIGESGYASPYDNRTKLVYRLLEQLKQIVK